VCKTSLYLSSAFVSAERLRIGLNLDTLIAMAPKKRANETTAPPWTQAKTDWQQLQTRRLEQMRAQFPATEPPSGRKYDQYSDIESHATVSLSPLDALLEKKKSVVACAGRRRQYAGHGALPAWRRRIKGDGFQT
jgi:hypothetical protein